MVQKVRNVTKSLAGMEDFQQLRGPHSQTRNGKNVTVHGMDVPYAVDTIVEMQALDTERFTHARVYSDATTYVDYSFDASAVAGVAPDGVIAGFWVEAVKDSIVLRDTVTSSLYRVTVVSGVLTVAAV